MAHTLRMTYTTISHRLTMPWRLWISPPANVCRPSRSAGSSSRGIRVLLRAQHLVLGRFHVAQRAAGGAPHERAHGGEPHQHRHHELAEGEVFEHHSCTPG